MFDFDVHKWKRNNQIKYHNSFFNRRCCSIRALRRTVTLGIIAFFVAMRGLRLKGATFSVDIILDVLFGSMALGTSFRSMKRLFCDRVLTCVITLSISSNAFENPFFFQYFFFISSPSRNLVMKLSGIFMPRDWLHTIKYSVRSGVIISTSFAFPYLAGTPKKNSSHQRPEIYVILAGHGQKNFNLA